MKKITLEPFPQVKYESGEFHYIPPEFCITDEIVLVGRLISTRGGKCAYWLVGEKASKALNNAPYCPMIRAIVTQFIWYPPASLGEPSEAEMEDDMVYQLGSGVINWKAKVIRPLEDPLRDIVVKIWHEAKDKDPLNFQGHLDVRTHNISQEDQIQVPYSFRGFCRLYNHYIYPVARWAYRVIDNTAIAIAIPFYNENRIIITSPDHLHEDRIIVVKKGDILVLSHPVPAPNKHID